MVNRYLVRGLVCAGLLSIAPLAFPQTPANTENDTQYLALGDSIAFGFDPNVALGDLSNYKGYPVYVAAALQKRVANASCMWEWSGSFLDVKKDFGAILPPPYNALFSCQGWRAALPAFVNYAGSQMDYANQYLASNPNTALVTIDIGGNDLLPLQLKCQTSSICAAQALPSALATLGQNLKKTFGEIRKRYQGPVVVLTYYAFNYADPLQFGSFSALNTVIAGTAAAYNMKVADVFRAFLVESAPFKGDACAAGLLAVQANGQCDTHPTAKGQQLIAATVLGALTKR